MGDERVLIKRILFATDFSTCAHYAEQHVVFFSKACGATVEVLHVLQLYPGVYPTVQDHRETDQQLADVVRRIQQAGVLITKQQEIGFPSVVICEEARKSDTDLIIMGTHGRAGLEHVLLGSIAERVLTMAPCPVLTAREPRGAEVPKMKTKNKFKHIVAPIDFSDCSMDALEYAILLAKQLGASLTLLHVLEPVSYAHDLILRPVMERHPEQINSALKRLASVIRTHLLSVREAICGGLPADSIVEFVRVSHCDLIVMGTHGRRGILHLMRGSVAEAVLRRTSCPVLAVKSPRFAPGSRSLLAV